MSVTFPVTTLCGSMRFDDEMRRVATDLTAGGVIVIAPHVVVIQEEQKHAHKAMLDLMHRHKIDMAEYITVVTDEHAYIGPSTVAEIEYAASLHKPIGWALCSDDEITYSESPYELAERGRLDRFGPMTERQTNELTYALENLDEFEMVLNGDNVRMRLDSEHGPLLDAPLEVIPALARHRGVLQVFSYNDLDDEGAPTGERLFAALACMPVQLPKQRNHDRG